MAILKKPVRVLVIVLLLAAVLYMVFAYPWLRHMGRENDGIRYTLNTYTGTLVFSGHGEVVPDGLESAQHWYTELFPETHAVYAKGRGQSAFWTRSAIDLYPIRDSVRTIVVKEGITQFSNAIAPEYGNLNAIYFPASLTALDSGVFHDAAPRFLYFSGDAPQLGVYAPRMVLDDLLAMGDDLTIVHKPGAKGFDAEPWQQFHVVEQDFRTP